MLHSLRLCLPGLSRLRSGLRLGYAPASLTHLACHLSAGTREARKPRRVKRPPGSLKSRPAERQPQAP